MAPRARAQKAAPEPEEVEDDVLDLTVYADKVHTPTAQAYAEWIEEQTGYAPDEKSVYLAMSLRRKFQHDADTRTRIAEIRDERKPAPAEPAEPAAPKTRRGAAANVTSTSTTSKTPARGKATTAAKPAAPARGRSRKPAQTAEAASAPF